jgi:large subunit ribosomal protein L1
MHKQGKKFLRAAKQVEQRPYQLNDAVPLVQKIKFATFDQTVELHLRLGVDPKHADQMVRGTVVLPNGLGKSKKVRVIDSGFENVEKIGTECHFCGIFSTSILCELRFLLQARLYWLFDR